MKGSEETYAAASPRVKKPGKFFLILLILLVFSFFLQAGLRSFRGKKTGAGGTNLVEDPARAVFKEEDIAKSLAAFGRGARESYLRKWQTRQEGLHSPTVSSGREKLGPLLVVRHEEIVAPVANLSFSPPEPIGLPLGTKMLALLKDKIFSFNVENQIETELLKDVYYLGKLRLPRGTKFFGQVLILHSEDRVNIRFHKFLLPWGEEREVRAVAHSLDGSGGIKGKVHRHFAKRFFSIAGKTTLGALTLFTVQNRQDAFSLDDQLRLTAAGNLSEEAQRELDTLKTAKAITVEGSIPILIVLLESV